MKMLLHFDDLPRQAFVRGFVRGLAAPVALFGTYTAPAIPKPITIVPPSHYRSDAEALAGDWQRVGAALRNTLQAHGTPKPKATRPKKRRR